MGEREAEDGDIAEDTRDGDTQLGQEDVDAVAVHPGFPNLIPRATLKGGGKYTGEIPARRDGTAYITPFSDRRQGEDAEVQEEEGDLVHVDASNVDDFSPDDRLTSRRNMLARRRRR